MFEQSERLPIDQRIVYEDNHVLVVNKYAGELSQSDKTKDPSLVDVIAEYRRQSERKPGNAFVGLVHRLDRPTSGLLVFAKTSKALARLNAVFQSHSLKKTYWAICDAPMPSEAGVLQHYLSRNEARNTSTAWDEDAKGRQEARLTYKQLEKTDRYYLLEVQIETGRHHQIRAQLQSIGVHIKGDLKYGAKRSNPDGSISLHAAKLSLPHPVSGLVMDLFADPVQVRSDVLWTHFT
jgi:23S rRNA pseudouridine1911/1915/1917 synthase